MLICTHTRAVKKLKWLLCIFLLLSLDHAWAEPRWALLVEPSFMDYKMRRRIPGSERTILVMARIIDGNILPLTREEKKHINITFAQIEAAAQQTASQVLAHLEPRFVRDKNGVVDYAILESDDPLTASCVLAPEFTEKFSEVLGPDLLVAMPNRYQVLVFSRQDTAFERMSEFIISGYLGSNYPVSREIFALEKGHLRSFKLFK